MLTPTHDDAGLLAALLACALVACGVAHLLFGLWKARRRPLQSALTSCGRARLTAALGAVAYLAVLSPTLGLVQASSAYCFGQARRK